MFSRMTLKNVGVSLVEFVVLAISLLVSAPVHAQTVSSTKQQSLPELAHHFVPSFFKLPPHIYMGEAHGVAVNSKGDIFVFNRGDRPLMQFDRSGKFVQTIGDGVRGFVAPHSVRMDAENNIWTVDEGSNMVIKFSPEGEVLMVFGRSQPLYQSHGFIDSGAPPPPPVNDFFNRPTDVAFDASGNIFVADGYGNSRIVKYDKNGKFVKSWGKRGTGPGEFNTPHSVVIDAKGLVYVADRENKRIQIFDSDGRFVKEWTGMGTPAWLCISGPSDKQFLYVADSQVDRISKVELNGNVLAAFGETGKAPGQFFHAHSVACSSPNELYVADDLNWRVQKFTLPDNH
jgi:DNA-binding beta-propeller fold protein YncE